jgi:hypothetical protein
MRVAEEAASDAQPALVLLREAQLNVDLDTLLRHFVVEEEIEVNLRIAMNFWS